MRLKCPASFRIIRVPCTGKVDVIHILRAFEKGADGVFVVGCMEGECHYNSGNFRAKKRVAQVAALLEKIGIEGERAQMYNLSSGEGPLFAQYAIEMDLKIRTLGPSPIRLAGMEKQKVACEST